MRTGFPCLAYALAIVAIAIGADRLSAGILYGYNAGFAPAAGSYYHPTVAQKLQQIQNRDPDQMDPLFIGNSLTMLGLDPASFDRAIAQRGGASDSYNLAIPSVGVTFWPEFFDRYWRDPIPRNLLLGLQPRDVNPRGTALTVDFIDRFFVSGGPESGIQHFAEHLLSSAFVLWQRRGTLFIDANRAPIGTGPGSTDITVKGPQGFGITGPPFTFSAAELRRNKRRLPPPEGPPFEFDPAAEQALDRLAAQQAAVGGRLILFTFPIFFDSEPEGAPGVQADFVRAMRSYTAQHENVEFIDTATETRSEFSASDYVDENHFDPAAARRFSAELARRVGPALSGD
jgi:hypothetical protein